MIWGIFFSFFRKSRKKTSHIVSSKEFFFDLKFWLFLLFILILIFIFIHSFFFLFFKFVLWQIYPGPTLNHSITSAFYLCMHPPLCMCVYIHPPLCVCAYIFLCLPFPVHAPSCLCSTLSLPLNDRPVLCCVILWSAHPYPHPPLVTPPQLTFTFRGSGV